MEHLLSSLLNGKKYGIGGQTLGPNYTPRVDFLDHDFL
jgi:hypothetical protein